MWPGCGTGPLPRPIQGRGVQRTRRRCDVTQAGWDLQTLGQRWTWFNQELQIRLTDLTGDCPGGHRCLGDLGGTCWSPLPMGKSAGGAGQLWGVGPGVGGGASAHLRHCTGKGPQAGTAASPRGREGERAWPARPAAETTDCVPGSRTGSCLGFKTSFGAGGAAQARSAHLAFAGAWVQP